MGPNFVIQNFSFGMFFLFQIVRFSAFFKQRNRFWRKNSHSRLQESKGLKMAVFGVKVIKIVIFCPNTPKYSYLNLNNCMLEYFEKQILVPWGSPGYFGALSWVQIMECFQNTMDVVLQGLKVTPIPVSTLENFRTPTRASTSVCDKNEFQPF